jgi:yeast amino acid transporter
VQGWTTLSPFNAGNFVDAYILLPLFPIIYFGYKFVFKTRYWRSWEVDLDEGRRADRDSKKETRVEDGFNSSGRRPSILKRAWKNF